MNRQVIVTGGAGFIGLNLVEELLLKNERITIIDQLGSGSNQDALRELKWQNPELNYIVHQVESEQAESLMDMTASLADEVLIYHLAAESHVDRSIKNPKQTVIGNIAASTSVLEVARRHQNVKLLMVSTDEVYGDEGPFPTKWGTKLQPSSPYSSSKAASDLIALSYNKTFGLKVKMSRCCNNFGKYQDQEKFIPRIIRCIVENQPVPVYGNGQQWRQWVPVREHARRLIGLMESDELTTHVGGYTCQNIELIGMISDIIQENFGLRAEVNYVTDRPGHDFKYELYDENQTTDHGFRAALHTYVMEETPPLLLKKNKGL